MNRNVVKMLSKTQDMARSEKRVRRRNDRKRAARYDVKGRRIRTRFKKTVRIFAVCAIVFAGLCILIYLPPVFGRGTKKALEGSVTADASALRKSTRYAKDNPDSDFDSDKMPNSLEEQYGTSLFWEDTDYDGISDYAEVFLTKTSPATKDSSLIQEVVSEDKERGDTIGTPYKIDDIIFWPDNYESKAKGGVVRTLNGFRFCFFKGWVRFPEKVFAYAYEDGVHRELLHREEEDAWYIDGSCEVRCYLDKLRFVNELELPFAGKICLDDSSMSRMLSKILPDGGGIITCRRIAEIDEDQDTSIDVVNPVVMPYFDRSDLARFGKNQNMLKDYSYVIRTLEKGLCVAVSMYSPGVGEAEGVIYGYTPDGDLLVADPESLKAAGTIYVTEYAMRMMGPDGQIGQHTWFEWEGLGFDSVRNGDRIVFGASSASSDLMEYEAETEGGNS